MNPHSILRWKKHFILAGSLLLLYSCNIQTARFSRNDRAMINSGNEQELMYIYNINNPRDTCVLRSISANLNKKAVRSKQYAKLKTRMLRTVTDSTVDGVGIAAPQVGINKRVIAVQRYDKPGYPFEVYANIRIEKRYGNLKKGMEGCLSVPGRNGLVPRNDTILISYLNEQTLKPVRDTVTGYTAVIFQHETDHLEGKLYIDYRITEKSKTD